MQLFPLSLLLVLPVSQEGCNCSATVPFVTVIGVSCWSGRMHLLCDSTCSVTPQVTNDDLTLIFFDGLRLRISCYVAVSYEKWFEDAVRVAGYVRHSARQWFRGGAGDRATVQHRSRQVPRRSLRCRHLSEVWLQRALPSNGHPTQDSPPSPRLILCHCAIWLLQTSVVYIAAWAGCWYW